MKIVYPLLLLTSIAYVSSGDIGPEDGINHFKLALESGSYLDKTLLIKTFIRGSKIDPFFVTAPSQFGKTTLIHMLASFFENNSQHIQKNTKDTLKNVPNYELFCAAGEGLKICKEEDFMVEHMGQYPVVQIDYYNLKDTISYEDALDLFRDIYLASYSKHKAMLTNHTFLKKTSDGVNVLYGWLKDKEAWKNLSNSRKRTKILRAIPKLIEAIKLWTGKNIILLTDEFDALCQALLFNSVPKEETKEITDLMRSISSKIYKGRSCSIRRALITGILRAKEMGMSYVVVDPVKYYEDNDIAKYYRLSEGEVKSLVQKVRQNDSDNVCKYLKENYDGYFVQNSNGVTFYSSSHVFKYLRVTKVEQTTIFWDKLITRLCSITSFITDLNSILNYQQCSINDVDLTFPVVKSISDTLGYLSSNTNSSKYEDEIQDGFYQKIRSIVFSIMIDCGYLTFIVSPIEEIDVLAPNQHMRDMFRKILNNAYLKKIQSLNLLGLQQERLNFLNSIISLTEYTLTAAHFKNVFGTLHKYLTKANSIYKEFELQTMVTWPLLEYYQRFEQRFHLELRTQMTDDNGKTTSGEIDIYCRNKNNVIIVIELQQINCETEGQQPLLTKANKGMNQIYQKYHKYIFNNTLNDNFTLRDNKTTAVLYMSLAYNIRTTFIQTVFSVPKFINGGAEEDKRKRIYFPPKTIKNKPSQKKKIQIKQKNK